MNSFEFFYLSLVINKAALGEGNQELIAQLHEKIGQLTVEADWLKKSASS